MSLLLSLGLALPLAACAPLPTVVPTEAPTEAPAPTDTAAPAPTEDSTITVVDSLGREVTLTAPPQKIVSLAPSNTEILFALGAGDRLIGRDEFSDYPAEALDVPSIGSLYPSVNTEAVVALEPDLVLAAGITNPDDVQKLADLGLTVFTTRIAGTIDDIYADITDVGTLIGKDEAAAALVAQMQARVAAVEAATANVTERPTVFYELDATDPSSPYTTGPGTFNDQLINLAGGENVGNLSTEMYFQISLEQLVAADPQIIVLGSSLYGGQTPELVAARDGWANISAVKTGKVYTFNDNLISRPGPRIVDGLEELAKLIHPELFQ
ncbi:MAG: cobalamin-binding protein [Anaerolineales bacterium]|nr:cobalamin-binding protein [Anaerolineales bacterium]